MAKHTFKANARSIVIDISVHGDWVVLDIAEAGTHQRLPVSPELAMKMSDDLAAQARIVSHKRKSAVKPQAPS